MIILFEDILVSGSILAICVLGFSFSLKVLNFPDLSIDGNFSFGAAICATSLLFGLSPFFSILLGGLAGFLSGMLLGTIHSYLKIGKLLSGILMLSILYSASLLVMQGSNISLLNIQSFFEIPPNRNLNINHLIPIKTTIGLILLLALLIVSLTFFLKTKLGLFLRATGNNDLAFQASGKNSKPFKVVGMGISGIFIGVSGSLSALHRGSADVNMGIGYLIIMLAAYLIGVYGIRTVCILIIGRKQKGNWIEFDKFQSSKLSIILLFLSAIFGAYIYQIILSFSLRFGMWNGGIKMATAVIIILILLISQKRRILDHGLL